MSRIVNATLAVALILSAATGLSAAEGHDHEHKGHDHGSMTALGSVTLGTVAAKVAGAGAPLAGKEWHVTVTLPAGTAAPKAIRVWVGIDSGRGSEKAKAEGEAEHPGEYAAHVNVPAPLPEGSQLWVSMEPATGDSIKGAVALVAGGESKPVAPAGHDHGAHDGHKH